MYYYYNPIFFRAHQPHMLPPSVLQKILDDGGPQYIGTMINGKEVIAQLLHVDAPSGMVTLNILKPGGKFYTIQIFHADMVGLKKYGYNPPPVKPEWCEWDPLDPECQ